MPGLLGIAGKAHPDQPAIALAGLLAPAHRAKIDGLRAKPERRRTSAAPATGELALSEAQPGLTLRLSDRSVNQRDTFTITLSTAGAPTGVSFDVQQRMGTGPWQKFRHGTKAMSLPFTPQAPGTYAFRSRIRRISNGGHSNYSPQGTIAVAAA